MLGDCRSPGRLEGEDLDLVLRQLTLEWGPVQSRSLATSRDPFLTGSEVVHEAEVDVAHRRPRGDRDGHREETDATLGVERPVDGIDDNVGLPVSLDSGFLGDDGHVEPGEPGEN